MWEYKRLTEHIHAPSSIDASAIIHKNRRVGAGTALTADRDRKLAMMGVQTGEDGADADNVDEAMRDAIDNMELDPDYFMYQMVQDDAVFKTIYDN